MARASNIYIVQNYFSKKVEAAFTVKHEMKTWLSKQNSLLKYEIITVGDNKPTYKKEKGINYESEIDGFRR